MPDSLFAAAQKQAAPTRAPAADPYLRWTGKLKAVSDLIQAPDSAPTATLFGGQLSVNWQFAPGAVD
jgi:hypothetical protein